MPKGEFVGWFAQGLVFSLMSNFKSLIVKVSKAVSKVSTYVKDEGNFI